MLEYTKLLLQKRQFEELETNARDVYFYVKVVQIDDVESVQLCMLVNNVEEDSVTSEQIIGMSGQIERNLLLKGFRNIDVMCIIFTGKGTPVSELLTSEVKFWLIDIKDKKLVIYDNQPDEYEAMKGSLEYELSYGMHKQAKKRIKRRYTHYVTWGLVIVNVLIFFIMGYLGDVYDPEFMLKWGADDWTRTFGQHEYYRLITCMFLHFGFEHLASNMFILAIIGNRIENTIGSVKFFIIYMISGIGASIVSSIYYMKTAGESVVSAGASGAIFGTMGIMAAMAIKDRNRIGADLGSRMVVILILIVIDGARTTQVDYMAHLGGLVVGFILTLFIYKEDARYARYTK